MAGELRKVGSSDSLSNLKDFELDDSNRVSEERTDGVGRGSIKPQSPAKRSLDSDRVTKSENIVGQVILGIFGVIPALCLFAILCNSQHGIPIFIR